MEDLLISATVDLPPAEPDLIDGDVERRVTTTCLFLFVELGARPAARCVDSGGIFGAGVTRTLG